MKITFTPEKNSTAITFTEGTQNRFVEKDGGTSLSIGYGKDKTLARRKAILFLRKIISVAKQNKLKSIALDWEEVRRIVSSDVTDTDLGQILAVSLSMANFDFVAYKTKPKDGFPFVEVVSLLNASKDLQKDIRRGEIIGAEVNAARELSNMPGGDMTPKILAAAAKKAIAGTTATLKVLGTKEMQKLGMGAVLGIAKGSTEEPQFIVMEYWGSPSTPKGRSGQQKPVVFVGKGVTFDSGGLNIKPGDHMYEMHLDMSGGASVIHAVALAAKLKIKANVIGLVPAVENMPGNNAVRPGDMLTSLSGKTIEILNTDAEGRVILADGITYAKRYDPAVVVDVATLTGAVLTALGTQASGLMSNDQQLEDDLRALGEVSGDYVWPFPLWDEYEDMVKGTFGDVPNISTSGNSRDGGVIAGGMFLREFAKELGCPWAHLDIASRMTATSGEFLSKGSVGAPVRLLLALAEHYAKRTDR